MGCESMDDTGLADVIVSCGASAVVGWRGPVSIDESDMVALRSLEILISGSSVGEAVELVDGEFGLGGRLFSIPSRHMGSGC